MKKSTQIGMGLLAMATVAFPAAAYSQDEHSHKHEHGEPQKAKVANFHAVVNSVDKQAGTINVSHKAVKKLGWSAGTTDMKVASDVSIDKIGVGEEAVLTVKLADDGTYIVTEVKGHHH